MIEFKFEKEKEILLHYAELRNNQLVKQFVKSGSIDNKNDVKAIAKFYWEIVDLSVKEEKLNECKFDDMDKWLERIYTSLHIYFNNIGFEELWESEIP